MGFIDDLPENIASPAAQSMILQAVRDGSATIEWETISIASAAGDLMIEVSRDAIKVEGVRVNVSAITLQGMADSLDALMLTPALSDQIWERAPVKIRPVTRPITSSKAGMIAQSEEVDQIVGERSGIVADSGKDWVLVNKLLREPTSKRLGYPLVAANYGWHFVGSGGEPSVRGNSRVIQSVGLWHDRFHTDYSQHARLARRGAIIDGQTVDLANIYRSESLSHLVSAEGPLHIIRQPTNGVVKGETHPLAKKKKKTSPAAVVATGAVGAIAGGAAGGGPGALVGGVVGALIGTQVKS